MSNRKVEVLNKYLSNLTNLGFNKEDEKVKMIMKEIESELGLLTVEKIMTSKDTKKALVVAIKDVTGSVGKWEHALFNEYYQLAIKEIKQKYNDVEELFITHNTEAKVVSKDEFTSVSPTGGTIVSSALRKLKEYLETEREVIVIQFSDGDNLTSDCARIVKLLQEEILPKVKYFKYFEANAYNRHSTLIHSAYRNIKESNFNFVVAIQKDDALKGLRFGDELEKLK